MWKIGVNTGRGKSSWSEYFLLRSGRSRNCLKFRPRDPREIKTVERWDPFRTTDSISCNPYPGGMPLEYSWFLLSAYRCTRNRGTNLDIRCIRMCAFPLRKLGTAPDNTSRAASQLPLSKFSHKDRLYPRKDFRKIPIENPIVRDERVSDT